MYDVDSDAPKDNDLKASETAQLVRFEFMLRYHLAKNKLISWASFCGFAATGLYHKDDFKRFHCGVLWRHKLIRTCHIWHLWQVVAYYSVLDNGCQPSQITWDPYTGFDNADEDSGADSAGTGNSASSLVIGFAGLVMAALLL